LRGGKPWAVDNELAQRRWQVSERLAGLQFGSQPRSPSLGARLTQHAHQLCDQSIGFDRNAEFQALQAHFTEQEIVELTWAVGSINAWNRMAIGMHQPVDDKPIE
jgi:hypothetical protein